MTQEKKNKRLLISLVVLAVLTVGFYFMTNQPRKANVDASMFKLDAGTDVTRIVMESASGNIVLEVSGTRWTVNNQYEADRQLVKLLLATLEKAEPVRPVPASQSGRVDSILQKSGVNVRLFANEVLLQSFKAGGNEQKTETYFKKENQPAVLMAVPGYRMYVASILELNEGGWRDKRVFNFNWRNFKSLRMSAAADSSQDFEVSFKDQFFGIKGMEAVDTTKLNDYLDAVSLLSAEQFIAPGASSLYDSLLKARPAFRIEIRDIADKTYTLEMFAPLRNDPNVLGKLDGNQPAIFSRNNILPIAIKRNYFLQKQVGVEPPK